VVSANTDKNSGMPWSARNGESLWLKVQSYPSRQLMIYGRGGVLAYAACDVTFCNYSANITLATATRL